MFRTARGEKKQLEADAILPILQQVQFGVLAVADDNGYPYAVPLNFAYEDGKIYIHGAREGHKADALAADPKVSFCIVAEATVKPADFTCAFTSVILFGTARELDGDEKRAAIELLVKKYSADYWEKAQKVIPAVWDKFATFEIVIEHMTGKQSR